MKKNIIPLIVVIGLGVYVGLNLNNNGNQTEQLTVSNVSNSKSNEMDSVGELSLEEKQKRFMAYYEKVIQLFDSFEKVDEAVKTLSNSDPSILESYQNFQKLRDLMEQGQSMPISSPEGFNESETEMFNTVDSGLSEAFQYRKFAYEHMMEYLDTDSLEKADEGKQWLESANYSLNSAMTNLATLKLMFDPGENKE
ncbi:hypothetical protein [Aquibacillus rhizosphaerae]|uniref:Uncharacterized protein n=1 Tax=Aquibacillus rhizosphaerae TaxID=3051431 RepID=A0ABT7LBB4_9BACI|nr:hypothetical protein [Aquibacillus sp. LR5S19]MDL4842480.1 hypothetical protein [Aquibacillus sp. LR5S19]